MVSGQLSALLLDWTTAVIDLNISNAHTLLEKEPELLWTPIPHSLSDIDHLQDHLVHLNKLGTSFQPMSAIQFTLVYFNEREEQEIEGDRFKFLTYLIEQSSLHDLDTRFWGECNNTTLHLVCFLGYEKIVQLLIDKGVSVTPTNELGYIPRDVVAVVDTESMIIPLLTQAAAAAASVNTNNTTLKKSNTTTKKTTTTLDRSKSSALRPNYSTPDRFKLLRELAEESTVVEQQQKKKPMAVTLDRQKSEGHYFRKGRVKETQKKVLTEEEVVELEKQRTKRQLEVAQLVKKSAVKNNPLFKKLEKRSFTSPTPSPSTSTTNLAAAVVVAGDEPIHPNLEGVTEALKDVDVDGEPVIRPKRNSKVISSLQKKSYVSTSVFVQADEFEPRQLPPPIAAMPVTTTTTTAAVNEDDDADKKDTMFISQEGARVTQQSLDDDEAQCTTTTILSNEPSEIEYEDHHPIYYNNEKEITMHSSEEEDDYYELETNEDVVESLGVATAAASITTTPTLGTRKQILEIHPIQTNIMNGGELTSSDDDDDDEDEYEDDSDNEIEQATPVQFATRIVSPVYKSVVLLSEEEKLNHLEEKRQKGPSSSSSLEQILDEKQPLQVETSTSNSSSSSSSSSSGSSTRSHSSDGTGVVDDSIPHQYSSSNTSIASSTTKDRPSNPRSSSLLLQIKTENLVSKPSPEHVIPVRPQRSELRRGSNTSNNNNAASPVKLMENESKEKKRMSGSQKAAWTMSMSSWAAILDREFNLDELDQEKKLKQHQQQALKDQIVEEPPHSRPSIDYLSGHGSDNSSKLQLSEDEIEVIFQGSLSRSSLSPTSPLSSTLTSFDNTPSTHSTPSPPPRRQPPSTVTTPLPRAPQIEPAFPRLQTHKSVSRKPLTASISESTIRSSMVSNMPAKQHSVPASINIKHRGDHGKLYLHVNDISDILLPLPKERAYVRCVVSDGRFEYMSRYEILSQNINFDYECVIDTHPDMIITISLHVRPDYVMKSRKPFSRLFSSKKKKESLSGYVNKEDGAIGQARFALAHMLPVCMETTYLAGFHCFNAWYSRSFKERHRQKKQDPDQDVLKVVGNFDVEMFYLPVQGYNKPFPRNLRECDMIIKQLHQSVRDSTEKYNTF